MISRRPLVGNDLACRLGISFANHRQEDLPFLGEQSHRVAYVVYAIIFFVAVVACRDLSSLRESSLNCKAHMKEPLECRSSSLDSSLASSWLKNSSFENDYYRYLQPRPASPSAGCSSCEGKSLLGNIGAFLRVKSVDLPDRVTCRSTRELPVVSGLIDPLVHSWKDLSGIFERQFFLRGPGP